MLLYLGLETLVDGELVVFDDEARPNLGRLLRRHGLTDPWRIRQAGQWFKQWVKTGNCPSLFEQLVSFYEEGCEPRRLIQLRRCLSRVQQNRCDWERFHRAAGVEESDGTQKNLDAYYQWSRTHNSLLIVTFDESDNKSYYLGLTNPFVLPRNQVKRDLQNHIPTIFAGAHIKSGDYHEGKGITHVNILRTLEAMYGLPKSGAQQPNAAGGGISDDFIITDVFEKVR